MKRLLKWLLPGLCLLALSSPALAQVAPKAYAPEDLRELSYNDQVRVISLEYREQSGGDRIPDDQLRFYLDQVDRSDWTFSQIRHDIARSLDGATGPGAPGWDGGSVRCESNDGRSRTCPTPWQGRSRVSRQLSGTPCEEGRTWSSRSGEVAVWGGCRAEFVADFLSGPDLGGAVRCESREGHTRTCPTPWRGRTRMVRQLSGTPCIEGRNWNSRDAHVTVWGGCRAEFASSRDTGPDYDQTVRCESTSNRTRSCPTPWRGPARLLRQVSGSSCIEGRSWDSQEGQVTVWAGCRGDFGPRRAWHGGGWDDSGYATTCTSLQGRYTTCHWPPGQGEPRLLQQLSDEACVRDRSWGVVDRSTIWVSRGCRARFGN